MLYHCILRIAWVGSGCLKNGWGKFSLFSIFWSTYLLPTSFSFVSTCASPATNKEFCIIKQHLRLICQAIAFTTFLKFLLLACLLVCELSAANDSTHLLVGTPWSMLRPIIVHNFFIILTTYYAMLFLLAKSSLDVFLLPSSHEYINEVVYFLLHYPIDGLPILIY